MCFKNYIQTAILYTKDIFDEFGEMHDTEYFSNRLKKPQYFKRIFYA